MTKQRRQHSPKAISSPPTNANSVNSNKQYHVQTWRGQLPPHRTNAGLRMAAVQAQQRQHGNRWVQRQLPQQNNPNMPEATGWESQRDEAKNAFTQANAAYQVGHYHRALQLFERIYALPDMKQSTRYSMAFDMATCHLRLGEREPAIPLLQEYLLQPQPKRRERALELLRQARSGAPPAAMDAEPTDDPATQAAANQQAESALVAGDNALNNEALDVALAHYTAAYNLPAARPALRREAAFNRGFVLRRLGDFQAAIDLLQESLGFAEIQAADRQSTIEQIRLARQGISSAALSPGKTMTRTEHQARFTAASALLKDGQYELAAGAFRELYAAPGLSSANKSVYAFNLGVCEQRQGNFPTALSLFNEVLLFPNLPGERRRRAEQHIRQCRLGEVGHNVKMNRLERDGPAGTRQQLLASLLYFETGRSTLNEKGQQTIQDLASLLQEQQRAAPEMCFQLDLVGTASGRWRQTGGQSATDLNQQLSEQRVAQAENELRRRLPATALAAGIFQFDSRAEGSQLHQSLNLPPDDNSWIHRSVAVDVYATKRLP